jgi:hypothetical protein
MSHSSVQLSQMTPEFLTAVLQPVIGQNKATVTQVRPEQLIGPQSFNADVWRLYLTYARPCPTAPQSLIAKLPTADTELHERAAVFQPGLKENWFYRVAAPSSPICVPRCYYNALDAATGQSILLLEDLASAPSGNQRIGATLPQAKVALESAARLHAYWWADTTRLEIQELTNLLPATGVDEQKLVQELYDRAWPQFLSQGIVAIPDEVRHFGTAIVGRMNVIDKLIDRPDKTLVHGDYRLENIHFGQRDGEAACWVIDWEDVFWGSGLIDVSWFLGGCLPVEQSHQEISLLHEYHQILLEQDVVSYSWAQCYEDYRHVMCSNFVQGVLSATLDEAADELDRERARVIGQRFVAAVQRLQLPELLAL